MNKQSILLLIVFLSGCYSLFSATIPYAGKVSVNGVNFDGQAQFSFSILSPNGSVVWQQGTEAMPPSPSPWKMVATSSFLEGRE